MSPHFCTLVFELIKCLTSDDSLWSTTFNKFLISCFYGNLCLVSWWRHQIETSSTLLALCAGIHRSLVNSPHKGQWPGALMFSLICAWTNGWVNSRDAGDLRLHRAHYDVTVMVTPILRTKWVESWHRNYHSNDYKRNTPSRSINYPRWYWVDTPWPV